MNLPVCTTAADCAAHDQQRVALVGTYTRWSRRTGTPGRQVQIVPAGSTSGPFLEAGHDPRHVRSEAEIATFEGKRVRVVGTYVSQMPQVKPPEMQQLAGACLSDVESIELAE